MNNYPAQNFSINTAICDLVKKVGNYDSKVLFTENDYKIFILNKYCEIVKQDKTSHNRSVYAAPPVGGLASIRLGHSGTFCQPWSCYASPYTGWQNVVNSRNVMRHCILTWMVKATKLKRITGGLVMTKGTGENVSKRINSLQFLLMAFVVIIHNGINEKSFTERGITAAIPDYVESVQRFVGIITAIAVPLFFLISASLLYTKEQAFVPVLKKKCRSIAVPYILWNLLFALLYLTAQALPFTKAFFKTDAEHLISNYGVIDWIDVFWGKITYPNEYGHPFAGQFWFMRDLFILNLLFIGLKNLLTHFHWVY
jgi:hypothetical protein